MLKQFLQHQELIKITWNWYRHMILRCPSNSFSYCWRRLLCNFLLLFLVLIGTLLRLFFIYSTSCFCYWFLRLGIEGEKQFVSLSCVLDVAMRWEERAGEILSSKASISDFEDMLRFTNSWDACSIFSNYDNLILADDIFLHMLVFCRASENIFVNLALLNDVKEALTEANSWLRNSKPYLVSSNCMSNSWRNVGDLQVHILSCLI